MEARVSINFTDGSFKDFTTKIDNLCVLEDTLFVDVDNEFDLTEIRSFDITPHLIPAQLSNPFS